MIKKSLGEKVFDIFLYIFMIILMFIFVFPFWQILVMAFNQANDTTLGGIILWPRKFTLQNFRVVFQNDMLVNAYMITIARTVIGTISSVVMTALFAYGLSKKKLMFRNFYFVLCIITMFFGGGLIAGVINIRNLGLSNNFLVYIIPGLYGVMNMLIIKSFFISLPASLEEAALIDGANDIQVFFKIVFPSSMPVISTIALMNAVGQWNAWFDAYLFITKESLMPVQLILQRVVLAANGSSAVRALLTNNQFLSQSITPYSVHLATLVVAIGPIVLIYPFFQKYFIKGFLIGSVKE